MVPEPDKLDKLPSLIVISSFIKLLVLSLEVNVSEIVESFDVSLLLTVDELIVIVGANLS